MNVSVLILTLNEELCLSKAIESVILWSDDIVILDSGSTDHTEKIANSYANVRFIHNQFIDFSTQRNFGLHSIEYKNDWLFLLDADEICPSNLQNEISSAVSMVGTEVTSFIVRRKDFYNGHWIKIHSSGWFERLVRPKHVKFTGIVHEKLYNLGEQVRLKNYLHHFPLAKGIHRWVQRHSYYAEEMARQEMNNIFKFSFTDILSSNPIIRTRAFKSVYLRLPGRWLAFFCHRLLFRGGLWGGLDSIHLTILETFYHFLVVTNIRSKKINQL